MPLCRLTVFLWVVWKRLLPAWIALIYIKYRSFPKFILVWNFLFKRIIPKLSLTKKYYFDITKGNDQLLSKAEGLGRLVSCGFKIMDFKSINGLIYFVVKKEKEPSYDRSPSYGPLYAMPRIGKNGKIIKVYKLRTMHPYSEYLQDYVLKVNGYAKPASLQTIFVFLPGENS